MFMRLRIVLDIGVLSGTRMHFIPSEKNPSMSLVSLSMARYVLDIPFFSIITMICEDFKISGELDGYTVLCNSLSGMRRGMRLMTEDKPKVIDDTQKQAIFDYIQNNQHAGREARQNHKQQVISYKDNLDELEKQNLCPYCKTELVLRKGRNGEFYGCKNYPKCRFTRKK